MSHLSTFTNFRLIRLVCNFELGSADSSPGPYAASGLQGGHAWLEERAQNAEGLPEGSRYSMNCVPAFSEPAQGWEDLPQVHFHTSPLLFYFE